MVTSLLFLRKASEREEGLKITLSFSLDVEEAGTNVI